MVPPFGEYCKQINRSSGGGRNPQISEDLPTTLRVFGRCISIIVEVNGVVRVGREPNLGLFHGRGRFDTNQSGSVASPAA